MRCRSRRGSPGCDCPENESDIAQDWRVGSESCLKKLVLEADATGFQDPEMGGWEQWKHLGEKNRARRARLGANGYILVATGRREK